MHDTAYRIGGLFFELYWQDAFRDIVEIGSYNVNGTLRDLRPPRSTYIGLDFDDGPGVDLRIGMHEKLPLEDQAADMVLASSAFEHDPCFWETFLEMARITRAGGFIYVNAPSNGWFHRYPVDCWRFYPDAGDALAQWACRCGQDVELVESCLAERGGDVWNDFVAVFHKKGTEPLKISRFLTDCIPCANIRRHSETELRHGRFETEDILIQHRLQAEIKEWRSREGLPGREEAAQRIEQYIAELQMTVQRLRGTMVNPRLPENGSALISDLPAV
jgi:SAM-dependent methyltransferase